MSQSALSKLLCGDIVADGDGINEVLSHLSTSIDNVLEELMQLESPNTNQVSMLAPFLGRSILELGCTAIIARLDPFRVLVLRKYQQQPQPTYKIDKPNKSSIHWQGDILAEGVKDLWSENSLKNPTRALLGDYYKTLIWEENYDKLLDGIRDVNGDQWISALKRKEFLQFYNETLKEFSEVYSGLSKGVHHEFIIPPDSTYDLETVKQLIEKTIRNIATLGLFISVIYHTLNKLDIQTAILTYKEIQEMEILS
jgi:hypothetical protein